MTNKKRGMSNADRVQGFFEEFPNETHTLAAIASSTNLSPNMVRGAIAYLAAKHRAGKAIEIRVVERGGSWKYVPETAKPRVHKKKTNGPRRVGTADFNRMTDALGHEDKPNPAAALRDDPDAEERRANAVSEIRAQDITGGTLRVSGDGLAKLTAELRNMHPPRRLVLTYVGRTDEGYAIGKDEDTGNAFKVVPL